MLLPTGKVQHATADAVASEVYDVVIVGSGIAGAIVAKELGKHGQRVLILEAGLGDNLTYPGYHEHVDRFYQAPSKDNQSPYPVNLNASMPRSGDVTKLTPGVPESSSYLVQTGPYGTDTTYTRVLGGTTMHWEAKVLRMLPQDFTMETSFGLGKDWPLSYDDVEPFYRLAERELGVSGDVDDQQYAGLTFPDRYVFPMQGLPLSYLDKQVRKGVKGTSVELAGTSYDLDVLPFPQARNGVPNPAYDGDKGFDPMGAVGTKDLIEGARCQGNNACVPICPVQAKATAVKPLAHALQSTTVKVLPRAVASRVVIDNGRVGHIEFKQYDDPSSPKHRKGIARGKIYVLAANAIENPRLLLASDLPSTSKLVGCNLMDHAYLLAWGLMPERCGTMRGTNCTGGIVSLRAGTFRSDQAAFSVDIHNDGWGWATGAPYSDLLEMVDTDKKFGARLRSDLVERITRQLMLAFMIEVPPVESNRVTVDPTYKDQLGNMRPVISYAIPDYTLRGAAYARRFSRIVFDRVGATDHTAYDPDDYGYVTYDGEGYAIRGGNHLAGTHTMGTNASDSVVNADQRSHDHDNLYVVGGGSLRTIATANTTLTIAALSFKSAAAILAQLVA